MILNGYFQRGTKPRSALDLFRIVVVLALLLVLVDAATEGSLTGILQFMSDLKKKCMDEAFKACGLTFPLNTNLDTEQSLLDAGYTPEQVQQLNDYLDKCVTSALGPSATDYDYDQDLGTPLECVGDACAYSIRNTR